MTNEERGDWRLAFLRPYLNDVTWFHAVYKAPGPDWDHDHCMGCNVKFMEGDYPGVIHEGYNTTEGPWWLCETCFQDFRERFGWKLVEKPPVP